tara:strand:- start:87 stop:740 length:654 start_codon:yes stop_codon:yes gene_type:complete
MIIEILFVIFLCISYFLFYVEYKINKHNKIYEYTKELTRQNINNEILLKMPFYFRANHLNAPLNVSNYKIGVKDKINKTKEYVIVESKLELLKPYIKSNTINKLYSIKNGGKIGIHANNESINYYFVRHGNAKIFLIHPKFKDNFLSNQCGDVKEIESYIENSEHFPRVDCEKGTIIFVPNNWLVYLKNIGSKDCWVEKLTFSTIINELMLYYKKKI